MNDAELLLTLAERCEREEPSSMLDWAIHEMANPKGKEDDDPRCLPSVGGNTRPDGAQ